ncbi:unnamed protein product [Mucor hiemalis]
MNLTTQPQHSYATTTTTTVLSPYYSIYKSGVELSELCSTVVQILCRGDVSWDFDRQMNFSIFCNQLVTQMNIPAPVVYTGLKYLQTILANSVNEYNVIDLSDIAHEYSLFTVSLLLAYKFLEDNPPYMSQWSFSSMIPVKELVLLESQVLNTLGFTLNFSTDQFYEWTEQCNTLYDIPYMSLNQLNIFDLHMTHSTLGYVTLLPVLLNDFYIVGSMTPSLTSQQTSPILTPDYFFMDDCNTLLLQHDLILYPPTTTPTTSDNCFYPLDCSLLNQLYNNISNTQTAIFF